MGIFLSILHIAMGQCQQKIRELPSMQRLHGRKAKTQLPIKKHTYSYLEGSLFLLYNAKTADLVALSNSGQLLDCWAGYWRNYQESSHSKLKPLNDLQSQTELYLQGRKGLETTFSPSNQRQQKWRETLNQSQHVIFPTFFVDWLSKRELQVHI